MFYTSVCVQGDKVLYRGIDDEGNQVKGIEKYKPHIYIDASKDMETNWKTIYGSPVVRKDFDNIRSYYNFIKEYKDLDGFSMYGYKNLPIQYINEHFPEEVEYNQNQISTFTIDIETTAEGPIDPLSANEELISITIYDNLKNKIWLINNVKFGEVNLNDFQYIDPNDYGMEDVEIDHLQCTDEIPTINVFLEILETYTPDIITGWNSKGFDIPFLVNRITKVMGENTAERMSPWNKISSREYTNDYGKTGVDYTILGINHLDYMELYKDNPSIPIRESYSLDFVSGVELDIKKLDHSEFDTFRDFYKGNIQKFIEYNIVDVILLKMMEERIQLITQALALSYRSKINIEDVSGSIKLVEGACYSYALGKKKVFPLSHNNKKTKKYAGAFVKKPVVGGYDSVASFDLNSLYPCIIMQYNISPETLIDKRNPNIKIKFPINEDDKWITNMDDLVYQKIDLSYLKDKNICLAGNGYHFRRDKKGFIPEIIESWYKGRRENKNKMLECLQKAQDTKGEERQYWKTEARKFELKQLGEKILLNSVYGASGNEHFIFFDIRMAEAITLSGQYIINHIAEHVNDYLQKAVKNNNHYVTYVDTDSIYLELSNITDMLYKKNNNTSKIDIMDMFCKKKIEPFIEKSYQSLADYTNAFENHMVMKREVLASRGIWRAKKAYCLMVHDDEGVRLNPPKLKMMGLETAKSDTPAWCREKLSKAIEIALTSNEDDMHKFVEETTQEYKTLDTEILALPKGVNNIEKYEQEKGFKSGTPFNVKAAIVHNRLIDELKVQGVEKIKSGDRIKIAYLKNPNPTHTEYVGFVGELPKQFKLNKYVDKREMFNKKFLNPLDSIIGLIGWTKEPQVSLDDF